MAHERRIFADIEDSDLGLRGSPSLGNEIPAVPITESQAHHLFSVLRLKEGDPLVVVDRKRPRQFTARVEAVPGRKKGARGSVVIEAEIPSEADLCRGVLLFPLCKPKAVELICEKATELNIARIIFWQADRSVVKVGGEADQRDRHHRLATIAEAAACQSGRISIPVVQVTASLDVALKNLANCSLKLFGHLGAGAERLPAYDSPRDQGYDWYPAMAVGPEGDFTDRELALFVEAGFKPVTLGSTRLRAETAALVMLSWLALDL